MRGVMCRTYRCCALGHVRHRSRNDGAAASRRDGVDLRHVAAVGGGTAPIDWAAVARLERQGLTVREPDRLRVTEAGALLLDAILPLVVADA
jgi:hypothetical protein